jgi:Fe-S-cluster containining protein
MEGEIQSSCKECGGKCCHYFCFQIDTPDDFEQFENIRWFLLHEGISVHVEDGDWYISVANRCKALSADGQCTAYEDRPLICRRYATDNCDHTGSDYEFQEHFRTPEELARYARKTLGEKAFDRAQEKASRQPSRRAVRRAGKARAIEAPKGK